VIYTEISDEFALNFVHKRLAGAVGGFIGGGPLGGIKGFFGAGGGPRASLPAPPSGRFGGFGGGGAVYPGSPFGNKRSFTSNGGGLQVISKPGVRGTLEQFFPGGATGLQIAETVAHGAFALTDNCPKGYHPNRSTYYTQQGLVIQGTRCVRNRRRNLSNGRANSRSMRRISAWDKQERKRIKLIKAIARGH